MDTTEAIAILETGTARCPRCCGTGGWEGWPGFVCYRCGGAKRLPATARQILAAKRALGLTPPAKPRRTPPAVAVAPVVGGAVSMADWEGDVPF